MKLSLHIWVPATALFLGSCTGFFSQPSSFSPSETKVVTSQEVFSESNITLVYENVPKNVSAYCILENNTDKSDCFWISGSLPATYASESGDGVKILNIWTKNRRNSVSGPFSTNEFTIDSTGPVWTASGITHSSSYSSLTLSPSVSFSRSAQDALTSVRYQYAIGSGSGVANRANVKDWTTLSEDTVFQASGLNLTDGNTYYVSIRAVDEANNISTVHTSSGWIVNVNSPDPSFVGISPNSPSSDSTPTVSGNVAVSAQTVRFYSDASCTVLLGTGTRSEFVGAGIDITVPLNPGTPTAIYAQSEDGSSNLSNCVLMTSYRHDNVAPTIARVFSNTAAGTYTTGAVIDIRVEFNDNVTVVGTPILTLETGATDATLNYVSSPSGNVLLFNYTVASGHESADLNYTATTALTVGTSIKDAAGNDASLTLPGLATASSLAGQEALVIDAVPPAVPSIVLNSPAASPGTDSTPTFEVALTGGGNFAASDVITLHEGADCSAAAVATLTTQTGASALITRSSAMSEGSTNFRVKVADAAGNSSCSLANATAGLRVATYDFDNTAPAVPSIVLQAPATSPNTDSTPTFTIALTGGGNFIATDVITLHEGADCSGGAVGTLTSETGASALITRGSGMSEGSTNFRVKVTDAAGNSSCSLANATAGLRVSTYVYDTTAPAVPSIVLNSPASSPGNDSTPTFEVALTGGGNFVASDVITLHEGADCSGGAVATLSSETGTSALITRGSAMSEGTINFRVKVTDAAGNSSCSLANATAGLRLATYEYDNTAPAVPSIVLNSPASSPGNDSTPTFEVALTGGGNFAATDVITLHEGADCSASAVATLTSETGTSALITRSSAMSAGTTNFRAKVTDSSGNSSCSLANATAGLRVATYEYDNTAPAIPSIVLNSPATSPGNDSTPTFEIALTGGGNFAATDVITLHEGADCSGGAVATLTSETGASALITRGSAMTETTTNFRVKVSDAAGNSSCSLTNATAGLRVATYQYDNSGPPQPIIAVHTDTPSPGTSASPKFEITLTGAVNFEDGDVVTLYEGGNNTCNGTARGTSTVSGTVTNAVAITTNFALSNFGSVTYFAKVQDLASNSTCVSAGAAYVYRPDAPATLTRIDPAATPGNDSTPTIRVSGGGVANGSSIKLFTDSSCTTQVGTATADATPQGDVTTSALTAGAYLFYATVTINSAESACSTATAAYTLDTTAPAAPSIVLQSPASSPGVDSTPTFTVALTGGGNFESTDVITLHEGADCSGSAVATLTSETGASALITRGSAMTETTTDFRVKVTDEAGNSTCSTAHATAGLRLATYEYQNIAAPSGLSYSAPTAIYVYNDVNGTLTNNITSNSPTVTGTVASYSISPDLNAATGLTFNTSTGVISGKPTATAAAADYTVTATNAAGSTQAIVNIRTAPGFEVDNNGDATDSSTADNACATAGAVCTLRAAIVQINAMSAGVSRVIKIPAMTITLSSDLTALTKDIEIRGLTRETSIIHGNSAYRMFLKGANLSLLLYDLTLTHARTSSNGAVFNTSSYSGGVEFHRCIVSNSYSTNNANSATGGVIYGGTITITDSILEDNTHGTGSNVSLIKQGVITVDRSLFRNNQNVISSTSSGVITNSTFEGNIMRAATTGGVIINTGSFTLINNTIVNNTAGSGEMIRGAILRNNIILNNTHNGNGFCWNTTSEGGNIVFPAEADCVGHASDLSSADALLGPLADNGGATYTRAISTGSPVLGTAVSGNCPSVDQRGTARSGACDIGAYEETGTPGTYDTTFPNKATSLGWTTSSPSSSTSVTATWTVSDSGDLANQKFQLYTGSACNTRTGSLVDLASTTANTYSFSGSDGNTYSYRIYSYDTGGQYSYSACSSDMVVDTTAPMVPSIVLQSPASSPGTDSTPTFTVSLTGGSSFLASDTITLHEGADCSASAVATLTGETGMTALITRSSAMSEGSTDFRVKVTDAAGNSSCSSSNGTPGLEKATYVYDNTAPAAPSIALQSPATSPGTDSTPTFTITLTGSGNFLATDVITLHEGADCSGGAVASLTSETGTSALITRGSAMSEGSTDFRVKVADAAGNSTCSTAHATGGLRLATYVYDNTAPVVPLIAMSSGYNNPATQASPSFAITLTGAVNYTDGDVVTLYEGSNNTCNGTARGTSTISGGATSSVDIVTNSALSNFSTVSYFAKVADLAGNSTCSSAGISYTHRPAEPTTLTRQSPSGTPGNDTTPTIRVSGGGVASGATVKLFTDSSCTTEVGSATADATPQADITTSALSAGSYLFYSTVTINSVSSACSTAAVAYVLDTTAPAAPSIVLQSPASSPGNDSTPTFTIALTGGVNFEASDVITLHEGSDCSAAAVATLTSETGTSALITRGSAMAETTIDFRVKVTDEAGNATCSTSHATAGLRVATYQYQNVTAPTGLSYSAPTAIYVYNDANGTLTANITNNTPSVTGTVDSYAISPDLNANTGLTFNTTTGVISGKPTATYAATNYTITATNAGGSTQATVNIRTAPGFIVDDNGDATDSSTADNACSTAGAVCTLRAALVQHNAMSATSRVILIPTMTITLGGTQLAVTNSVEIIGAGQSNTIIEGNDASRVLNITNGTNIISYLNIQGGYLNAFSYGAGAYVSSGAGKPTTFNYVTFTDNFANHGSGAGGGLAAGSNSEIIVTNSIFFNNRSANRAASIYGVSGSSITVSDTILKNGSSVVGGTSLYAASGTVSVTINRVVMANNAGANDLYLAATTSTVNNLILTGYRGHSQGSLYADGTTLNLTNSTIANNNTTSNFAAGIYRNTGTVNVKNSILYNNKKGDGVVDNCNASVSVGYNISDTVSGDCGLTNTGDLPSTDPTLAALANYGGAFETMALLSGSPAIDAGTNTGCPASDVIGTSRPVNGTCDIGAFEGSAAGSALDVTAPSAATSLSWTTSSPSNSTSVTASWTVSGSGDLAEQHIQFYSDGTCTTKSGGQIHLLSISTNSYAFSGTDGSTYTYKVFSYDSGGNATPSACSSSMAIDTTAPSAPSIVLNDPGSSPGDDSTPRFEIALTGGGNFASSDVITLHEGADCSAAAVATLTTQTGTTALVTRGSSMSEGSVDFRVKVTDAAGNATCSTSHATAGLRVATYEYQHPSPTISYAGAAGTTGTRGAAMSVTPTTLTAGAGATITGCVIQAGGSLPTGVSIDNSSCVISGTPTTILSSTSFTVRVTNSFSKTADASVTLEVNEKWGDETNDSIGFAGSSRVGVAWNTDKMILTPDTDCDGNMSEGETVYVNCSEHNASWTPQWASLQSYWKLNNDSNDSVGSNTGTATNGATFTAIGSGKVGSHAASYDGTDDYTLIGDVFDFGAGAFAISFWVKSGDTQGGIITKDTWSGVNNGLGIYTYLGNYVFWNGSSSLVITGVDSNAWKHIVVSRSGTGANETKVYLNGIPVITTTDSRTYDNSISLRFMAASNGYYNSGSLDDVAIWSGASLSDADVRTIYERQVPTYSGYYTSRVFDAGAGNTWEGFKWLTTLPFGKELPGDADNSGTITSADSETSTDFSALVGSSGATGDNDLMSGLLGLWRFNEGAATGGADNDYADASGAGNFGESAGSMIFGRSGVFSNSARFDATDDYVYFGDNLYNSETDGTVAGWIRVVSRPGLSVGTSIFTAASSTDSAALISLGLWGLTATDTRLRVGGNRPSINYVYGSTSLTPGVWYHVAVKSESGAWKLFVNGAEETLTADSGSNTGYWFSDATNGTMRYAAGALMRSTGTTGYLSGYVDELAVWSRPLHNDEIKQLYRRGANRIRYQVRSCTASDCSDNPAWVGPSGTNSTYFSDLHSNTAIGTDSYPTGRVKVNFTDLVFFDFNSLVLATERYIQYRAVFETETSPASTMCNYGSGATWCSPELKSVTIKP